MLICIATVDDEADSGTCQDVLSDFDALSLWVRRATCPGEGKGEIGWHYVFRSHIRCAGACSTTQYIILHLFDAVTEVGSFLNGGERWTDHRYNHVFLRVNNNHCFYMQLPFNLCSGYPPIMSLYKLIHDQLLDLWIIIHIRAFLNLIKLQSCLTILASRSL